MEVSKRNKQDNTNEGIKEAIPEMKGAGVAFVYEHIDIWARKRYNYVYLTGTCINIQNAFLIGNIMIY